jgi:23S rRNA (adenine2503-C2)-methyltransferase
MSPTASSLDLLATTVEDLEARLESRTRATALRRFLIKERPRGLPRRIGGVAGEAWRRLLESAIFLPDWREISRTTSADGTLKLTLGFADAAVETALIPGRGRSTVCVSSQAGCTRRCDFCATARLGFGRNLRAGEIVLQYLLAADAAAADQPPRNVVFMGMGEPLDNLGEVLAAVRSLTDVLPGLSPRHVTVSTAGILPAMKRFLAECPASLALSLNATTDEARNRLMPHNAQWPIDGLLGVLRDAEARDPKRRSFIEYVLLAGVNDHAEDARRLGTLLRGLKTQMNLIPHNPFPESAYGTPSRAHTLRFQEELRAQGIQSIVRWPRGADIAGACGQLALRDAGTAARAARP